VGSKLYAVRDSKALIYAAPFTAHTNGQAIRQFLDWCSNSQTPLGLHPEDYTLHIIGEYDENTGEIEPVKAITIANGDEVSRNTPKKEIHLA